MKKFLIQATVLVLIIFLSLAFATSKLPFFSSEQTKQARISINNTVLNVEVADTSKLRQLGLGEREKLASDSGMLFIFPKKDKHRFWMKGLKFPLDLIWISNYKIVDLNKNVPPPKKGQKDIDLPIYMPVTEVDMVLEVNAGFSESSNTKIGDTINILR